MAWLESSALPDAAWPMLVAAVFWVAGIVKGVVGLGLPTVSMALLALMMPPAEAAALLIIPSLVTNVWQIGPWRSAIPLLRRLGSMQVGVCAGTLAGAWILGAPAGAWATVCLGAALIAYAGWGLAGTSLSMTSGREEWLGPLVGVATGWVSAATGVFVVPAVPYLQALRLRPDELLQAMGISFASSTLALMAGLLLNGRYSGVQLGTSLLMLLPALLGMAAGAMLRRRLAPARFRQCLLASLILLGLHMITHEMLTG